MQTVAIFICFMVVHCVGAADVNIRSLDKTSDFYGCFLQLQGGRARGDLMFLPQNFTTRTWQAFDTIRASWVPDTFLFYEFNNWNMGALDSTTTTRIGYFAGAGAADATCLTDGAQFYESNGSGGESQTGRLWGMQGPVYTSCPLKRGTPIVSESNIVTLRAKDVSSLRDCTLHAVQERPTASAVMYDEALRTCLAVIGPASYLKWNGTPRTFASCVFGCYGLPGVPYDGQTPSEVKFVASAVGLTLEECDRKANSEVSFSEGTQIVQPAVPTSTTVCNAVKALDAVLSSNHSAPWKAPVCFSPRRWRVGPSPSSSSTPTPTTPRTFLTTTPSPSTPSPSTPPTSTSAATNSGSGLPTYLIILISAGGGLILILVGGLLLYVCSARGPSETRGSDLQMSYYGRSPSIDAQYYH